MRRHERFVPLFQEFREEGYDTEQAMQMALTQSERG